MRIAFFSKDLPSDKPNGVSVQVHRLAQALSQKGHAVTCFSFSDRPAGARYAVSPLSYGQAPLLARKFIPALRFSAADTRPFDIVHYHGDDYLCAGRTNRVRTYYGSAGLEALHARSLSRKGYQALFYLFEWISAIHAGTKTGISYATTRALPFVKHVIPCGVPLDRYSPGGEKSTHPSILFLGDLQSRKRGALMLELFNNHILPKVPQCTLTVIGPQKCSGQGVRWLGNITENQLIEEYRHAWVLCVASSWEGLGVPAMEAMACGTPVVSTANPGAREVITHNLDGFLCRDSQLAARLNEVLLNTPLRSRLSAAALKSVRRFDIHTTASAYETIYQTLAASR